MIKIGLEGGNLTQHYAGQFAKLLSLNGLQHTFTIIGEENFTNKSNGREKPAEKQALSESLENALRKKEIDVVLCSLRDVPLQPDPDLVTAGIAPREDPSDVFLIRKSSYTTKKSFRLFENASAGIRSDRQAALLNHFRPDVRVENNEADASGKIQKMQSGEWDGFLISKQELDLIDTSEADWETVLLNPREFIPAPAQGVAAYRTRKEDLELRKTLGRLTDMRLVHTINVERKILRLLAEDPPYAIGVYCENDDMGHYHVWACYAKDKNHPLNFVQYSSSTNHELAETIAQKLTYDIDI